MSPVGFRTRLFLILTLFATLPSIVLTLMWGRDVREGFAVGQWKLGVGRARRQVDMQSPRPSRRRSHRVTEQRWAHGSSFRIASRGPPVRVYREGRRPHHCARRADRDGAC